MAISLWKARGQFPWVKFWLALGIALRVYHYLRDPAMWHDEAALVLNVLHKNFAEALGPLSFSEAAPPLFLWVEKAVALLLGDGTYALRLVPLAASCAALVGIVAVARRVLSPQAVPWLALLFGCSDRLLWHCCEAKPYAVDVFVATGLVSFLVLAGKRPLWLQLICLTILTPRLLFLSYPACFLLGGMALVLLPALFRGRRRVDWVLYAVFLAVLGGTFLVLLNGPIQAQRDPTLRECWRDMFPPWERAWTVPGWMLLRLSEVARYAEEPIGNVLLGSAVVGAVVLWRSGRRRLVAYLLAPIALAVIASLLGHYPVGATRVMVFAAPAVLLLAASGLPPILARLRRVAPLAPILAMAIVLFPVGQAGYRVVCPWDRADSARAAAYVEAERRSGEIVFGTNWEHDYYFRHLAGAYKALDRLGQASRRRQGIGTSSPAADRLWLVAAGKREERRERWLQDLTASGLWRVLERREFDQTTVFHLEFIRGGALLEQPGEQ